MAEKITVEGGSSIHVDVDLIEKQDEADEADEDGPRDARTILIVEPPGTRW